MDAGVAAVLGAAVGTIGTIATSWTSRSLAKIQMRVEFARERREPRRASYEAFSSAAIALHDHMEPWITFGRHLGRPRVSDGDGRQGAVDLSPGAFKEGYVRRAVELADDVSRYGRHVILDGPAELEPFVTTVIELSGALVAVFRIRQSLNRIADEEGRLIVAHDTSKLPDKLKQLEQGVREFLLQAGAALDRK
ncbi:hypothetical protein [Streptomyces scabiei]|uniref:hypothetical protein n=1 Tax=Streptomyces scabiei TaxID=1930 RepID=UPI0029B0BB97|nr:hypothetical protein [Streptomyces scabiei]MDX3118186.1 hypothetical protein [Streptomyces scabiei]